MPRGERARAAGWAGTATAAPGLLAFTGAIIPAGARHELRAASGAHGLLAYLDPAHPAGRAAGARIAAAGDAGTVSTWQVAARPPATTAVTGEITAPAALPGVLRSIGLPADGLSADTRRPPAVLSRALETVPRLIDGPLLLSEIAARVGVSASRLGHLFAEHLRLPFPAWRRWVRLLHAMEAVRGGATLTEAAHGAGFADSSHLTRVCHEMFGLAPSRLIHLVRPTA
ncbi:helix-turn-helix domain-containing protein [Planomonospora corallina]|uniref:Helix-turn-helix domain-containing protein n=1 Tax=Planomonospora corallina TaxID=1806052 RepID=A0ABV8I116_9ACTN